jgi:eukaryotic-like serine/threonine-protein kinase
MGDAVRDGDVHAADPEDTIDASASRAEPVPEAMPAAVLAAARDMRELVAVERHHYAITREIARGGIGRVFEARDLRLGRQVAIKELLPKNRDAARRFEREARITARLQHPAIIHVYEAGVWPGGEPFYAMPLVAGRSLDTVVAEKTTLAERLALLPNVIAVADALAYAHNANVIHRDLKPANVLVGEFGETVVIDWGLAKDLGVYSDPKESMQMRLRATAEETMSGSVVGTPAYMPPEQARGDAVDQRCDVYALGALLYKVLCGAAPYEGKSSIEVVELVKSTAPVPVQEREPAAPPDLVAIVAKAMARNVKDRYITASELAQDLKRFETGQLVGAHRYTTGELMRRWLRRHRVAVGVASAAAVALIVLGVFSLQRIVGEKRRADSERDNANLRRANLLQEEGRAQLLDGHAGNALAYLVGAAEDGKPDPARGFLIADAKRPFNAELAHIDVGTGPVVVAVSPDGKHIATAGDGDIVIRDAAGAIEKSLGPRGITRALTFDSQSTTLVAAGDDGIARVWALTRDGRLDVTLEAELRGHAGRILDAAFALGDRRIVTSGDDGSVRVWDRSTKSSTDVPCHVGPVTSVRISPDGKKALTASTDATACIIDLEARVPESPRTLRQLKGHTGPINAASWSADGSLVVTASRDGTARVWSAEFGKPIVESLRHEPGTSVQVALFTPDGLVVTAGSDFMVRIWELPSVAPKQGMATLPVKLVRKLVGHSVRVVVAAISADHRELVTGDFDGVAKVWDLESMQEVATFEHGDVITALAFVSGATKLAVGSGDGKARIWNTTLEKSYAAFDSAINAIAVSSSAVAVGLDDSDVKLLRDHDTLELHGPLGHLGSVRALAFAGNSLITGGDDAALIEWDATTGAQRRAFAEYAQKPAPPVRAIAVDHDGHRLALVRDGKVEVWSLAGKQLRVLTAAHGAVSSVAINPVTDAIAAVGAGAFAIWDRDGRALTAVPGAPYTSVAFSPRGDAVVTAGAGIGQVWTLDGDKLRPIPVTLEGGMGIVHAVLVTTDLVVTGSDHGRAMVWDRRTGKLLARRDRHDKPITSLAQRADKLWIGSEDQTLNAWDVSVDASSVAQLRKFMDERHVPVVLQDDVVRKKAR